MDSRASEDGLLVRRRRECVACGKRYTTHERIEIVPAMVIKANGTMEQFDANKVKNGILKSCEKRPVTTTQIEDMVRNVEKKITNSMLQEISSKQIGDMVMNELKSVDGVAYVRFASVHLQFADLVTLRNAIDVFLNNTAMGKDHQQND
jgi:transcriptional repressor NrdR